MTHFAFASSSIHSMTWTQNLMLWESTRSMSKPSGNFLMKRLIVLKKRCSCLQHFRFEHFLACVLSSFHVFTCSNQARPRFLPSAGHLSYPAVPILFSVFLLSVFHLVPQLKCSLRFICTFLIFKFSSLVLFLILSLGGSILIKNIISAVIL